jgi:hypothetical protein
MMKYLKVEPLEGSNGKAHVVRMMFADGNGEISVLFSYGLMMAVVCDGKMWKVNSSPSATTSRHVRAFTGLTQSQFNSLPSCAESSALSLDGPSSPVYGGNPRGEV